MSNINKDKGYKKMSPARAKATMSANRSKMWGLGFQGYTELRVSVCWRCLITGSLKKVCMHTYVYYRFYSYKGYVVAYNSEIKYKYI